MLLEKDKIYTNEEMAEWFGIKKKSFTDTKKKKLEILKDFADFEEAKGKIKILEVYEAEYISSRDRANNDKLYQKDIEKVIKKQPLQLFKTCAGRIQLLENSETKKLNHAFRTAYDYTRRNLREIAKGDKKIWCERRFGEERDFIPLNDEQLSTWKKLIDQAFNNEEIAGYKSQLENGELSMKEANSKITQATDAAWMLAKSLFEDQFGFVPVFVSNWELNAFNIEENIIEEYKQKALDGKLSQKEAAHAFYLIAGGAED